MREESCWVRTFWGAFVDSGCIKLLKWLVGCVVDQAMLSQSRWVACAGGWVGRVCLKEAFEMEVVLEMGFRLGKCYRVRSMTIATLVLNDWEWGRSETRTCSVNL